MHLPALTPALLLSRAQDPLTNGPDYLKDKFPPHPAMTNVDGSDIGVETCVALASVAETVARWMRRRP